MNKNVYKVYVDIKDKEDTVTTLTSIPLNICIYYIQTSCVEMITWESMNLLLEKRNAGTVFKFIELKKLTDEERHLLFLNNIEILEI